MKCPELEQILDLKEGRLERSAANQIQAHLKECADCEATARWAEKTLSALHSRSLVDAPEYAIQKAVGLFTAKKATLADWVLAKLNFDTGLMPATAGVRSANTAPRQRIFETDAYKIILMSEAGPENIRWTGQIVANQPDADTAGCLVELAKGKKIVGHSLTNQNGEFILNSPKGRVDLRLHCDPQSIIIPNLT